MKLSTIKEFAVKNGYKDAVFLKKWNGYNCYEPIMSKDGVSFIGLPLVIMEKDGKIRMSTADEAMEI